MAHDDTFARDLVQQLARFTLEDLTSDPLGTAMQMNIRLTGLPPHSDHDLRQF